MNTAHYCVKSWRGQVKSAVLAYNPRVRDGNRPGKQRLECVLTMLDGTRVRLYPGAKAIVEDSKFVSDRGDEVAVRDPTAIGSMDTIQALPQYDVLGHKDRAT